MLLQKPGKASFHGKWKRESNVHVLSEGSMKR